MLKNVECLGLDNINDVPNGMGTRMYSNTTSSGYDEENDKTDERVNFTVAEVQLFEKENSLLFNELNSLSEEVNQIQGRVVKIAELQQTFTEKVLDQEKDIERIATTTVSVKFGKSYNNIILLRVEFGFLSEKR